jgi:hypothetical protein
MSISRLQRFNIYGLLPRALPWAITFRAFGAVVASLDPYPHLRIATKRTEAADLFVQGTEVSDRQRTHRDGKN